MKEEQSRCRHEYCEYRLSYIQQPFQLVEMDGEKEFEDVVVRGAQESRGRAYDRRLLISDPAGASTDPESVPQMTPLR